jgi:hypothetical protein
MSIPLLELIYAANAAAKLYQDLARDMSTMTEEEALEAWERTVSNATSARLFFEARKAQALADPSPPQV